MALHHAASGDVVEVRAPGERIVDAPSTAIVRDVMYLAGGAAHALHAVEDTFVLATVVRLPS